MKNHKRRLLQSTKGRLRRAKLNDSDVGSSGSDRVFGILKPSQVVLPNILLGIFMSPLLLIGGVPIYWAIAGFQPKEALWLLTLVQFSFGLAFILLWFYTMWKNCIWLPAITITRYELNEQRFRFQTPRLGDLDISLNDLVKCIEQRSKVGLNGWWIQAKIHGWVYLHYDGPKEKELAFRVTNRISIKA